MDNKVYTDEKYIPLSELSALDTKSIAQIKEYRQEFLEIIQVDEFNFASVVETPSLIKKRYIKNVELKGNIDIKVKNNDYILELAKKIIQNNLPVDVKIKNKTKLIKMYKKNNKDLTIITDYLTNFVDNLIIFNNDDIKKLLPELSKNELRFIKSNYKNNLRYSINDFQTMNNTSYETARKAFEKLEDLNLYKKEKIGKKFLYRSTGKLIKIIEGDKQWT